MGKMRVSLYIFKRDVGQCRLVEFLESTIVLVSFIFAFLLNSISVTSNYNIWTLILAIQLLNTTKFLNWRTKSNSQVALCVFA